jgi:hypothetical protein
VGRAVHLAAGILVLQVPLVIAITSLFYIDLWLIVVYIVLVDYLVCKCDSEAARGKLNSLSDPNIHGVRFRARSIIVSYRVIVIVSYRIVSYQIWERENTEYKISKARSVQSKVRKNKKEYPKEGTERTDK